MCEGTSYRNTFTSQHYCNESTLTFDYTLFVSDFLVLVIFLYWQAQLIAQSIGQAFQVAYMEFLKANGIEDPGLMKEIDYQEVLNQQEIFGEELHLFSNKEMQKEVSAQLSAIQCQN